MPASRPSLDPQRTHRPADPHPAVTAWHAHLDAGRIGERLLLDPAVAATLAHSEAPRAGRLWRDQAARGMPGDPVEAARWAQMHTRAPLRTPATSATYARSSHTPTRPVQPSAPKIPPNPRKCAKSAAEAHADPASFAHFRPSAAPPPKEPRPASAG